MATVNLSAPTKDVVRELLRSPRAVLLREEIDAALDHERERRDAFYGDLNEDVRAEFINGEVVVQSPAKFRHTECVSNTLNLMRNYVLSRGLGVVGQEQMLVSLTRNDYAPDICYFGPDKASRFEPDQMKFPTPDLVVEVLSPTTEQIDRATKFEDYAAHGVTEYWIIDPDAQALEQYVLWEDRFELKVKSGTGVVGSVAIPGFEIPIPAVFDRQENLAALRRLLGG